MANITKDNDLQDFRLLYYKKYGVQLDDELLYILIRINELNVAINKDIERLEKKIDNQVSYRSKWDYFVHGLGKTVGYSIAAAALLIAVAIIFHK